MKEKQYCRQVRWHKKNLRTITAKLTKPEYEVFCTLCKANGTTPYRVMCRMARAYMRAAIKAMTEAAQ